MLRIAIAIHGEQNVDFGAYANHLSLMAIASQLPDVEIAIATTRGVRVAQARNEIVKQVQGQSCDYVFFLDTDHIVPLGILKHLLVDMEKYDCVSGLVCRRRDKMDHIGYNVAGKKFAKLRFSIGTGTHALDACAFGCTMIRMSVFDELEEPFFEDVSKGTWTMRSDVGFCLKLRSIGKSVAVNTGLLVGHIGDPIVVWPKTAEKLSELSKSGILGIIHA